MITSGTSLLDRFRSETPRMLDLLGELVAAESPSHDVAAVDACLQVVDAAARGLWGTAAEQVVRDGRTHLRWRFGSPRVVLLAHADTVWPRGTVEQRPFRVDGDVATGPGAFDMKAGIVQLLHGLAALADLDGVHVLVTGDEEVGSPTSRALIEETAGDAAAVLVLEPSERGALKTARKGVSTYEIVVTGRAAHAGLEPERGVNATVELAALVPRIMAAARPEIGTTVTPTLVQAGSTINSVPAEGRLAVDARAWTAEEQARVDAELRRLEPTLVGASMTVTGGPNRAPLEASASAGLFARAREVAASLGLADLEGVAVGGGSDGNFTAGLGVPTLDGLGAVGGGAHADDEHVLVTATVERTALLAALVDRLRREGS